MKTIFCLFCLSLPYFSSANELTNYLKKNWKLNKSQLNYLKNHEVLSSSKVTSDDHFQTFKLKAIAYHPKKCRQVLRKISLFENYKNWISFIKSSSYHKKSKLLSLKADHPLLPYPMIIYIHIKRPTQPGKYHFYFPTGIFAGLSGVLEVVALKKKCLLYAHSFWKGKKTNIPNFAIELFSETLSKMGGEIMMKKIR